MTIMIMMMMIISLLLALLYSWKKWGLKKLSTLPKITPGKRQSKDEFSGSLNSEPVLLAINVTAFSARQTEKVHRWSWAEA